MRTIAVTDSITCGACGAASTDPTAKRCRCGASLVLRTSGTNGWPSRLTRNIAIVVAGVVGLTIVILCTPTADSRLPPAATPVPIADEPSASYVVDRSRCGIRGRGERVELRFEERPSRATADALLSRYSAGLNQWSQVVVSVRDGDDYWPMAVENCDGTERLYPSF